MTTEIEDTTEESDPAKAPAWKRDQDAFLKHFKMSYEDFGDLLLALPDDLKTRYEKTRRANEEAAILWAIHEGQSHGLLE